MADFLAQSLAAAATKLTISDALRQHPPDLDPSSGAAAGSAGANQGSPPSGGDATPPTAEPGDPRADASVANVASGDSPAGDQHETDAIHGISGDARPSGQPETDALQGICPEGGAGSNGEAGAGRPSEASKAGSSGCAGAPAGGAAGAGGPGGAEGIKQRLESYVRTEFARLMAGGNLSPNEAAVLALKAAKEHVLKGKG